MEQKWIQPNIFDSEVGKKQLSQPLLSEKEEVWIKEVPGLLYIKNYITANAQDTLLAHVDNGLWLDDLKRRVQHYGFKYNYRARRVDMSMRVGELPEWLKSLSKKLHQDEYMPEVAGSGDCQRIPPRARDLSTY